MKTLSLIVLALMVGSCQQGFDVSPGGTFVVAVGAENFRVRIDNAFVASKARTQMNRLEAPQIVTGELARGDGGFNTGYGWHIRPNTIGLTDVTVPECSALPSAVQADINHWVDVVKRYCPTNGRFVQEVGR